jgi:hypothetical protein
MTETTLERLLCLPSEEVSALADGQLICALPNVQIQQGLTFSLYPLAEDRLFISDKYRPIFSKVETLSQQSQSQELKIWATCEHSTILHDESQLKALSELTIWTETFLRSFFQERHYLFLSYLRVYQLPKLILVPKMILSEKVGKFIGLSTLYPEQTLSRTGIKISQILPVVSDSSFVKRKQQLDELYPPEHPELEELHFQIAQMAIVNQSAKDTQLFIQEFLGWNVLRSHHKNDFNLKWVQSINELATRSQEQDDGRKSNYQAGTDFENVVRKSLEFLGFKVEEAYNGGAGGLDLYCSQPYDVVGECKAGKTIPDRSVEELDRIGKRHLQNDYSNAARLIIGPGKPTPNLQQSAIISKTSIINAMSLQKLVELQANYPGSVNLIELKKVIKPGQTDDKIDEYVEEVLQQLRLRSYIIQLVKKYQDSTKDEEVEIGTIFGAYIHSSSPYSLKQLELKEIMIELASPLVGYLGRIKGTDRFYFLRELLIK